jgi:hypothetical protein
MKIMRVFSLLMLASVSVWAQFSGMGSMRDPRETNTQGAGAIQPWLAGIGSYTTFLDQPESSQGSVYRTVGLNGGLSAAKSFQRTSLIFGYAGSGTDVLGQSAGIHEGWRFSNVGSLAVSSQVTYRVTLDFSESGGAGNGGFGATAAGLQSGGLGLLGSMGVASGFLSGGSAGLGGGSTGLDPLQNNLVDAEYYQHMTYFSSTSAGAGFLLTNRTMLNIGGTAAFVRRDGSTFSDANMLVANAMLSTQLSRRVTVFGGYSFNRIDYISSIGNANIQTGFVGVKSTLSPHDELSLAVSANYVETKFVSTVTLPPDIAALLGVATTTAVNDTSRWYSGGRLSYMHAFQRGGFNISCTSTIVPGNDLILLSRSQGCNVSLSRSLTPRFSVTGIGGIRRLTGQAQSGSRYDVASGGLLLSYRIFRGVSFTTGATFMASEVRPSTQTTTSVAAHIGLYWSPEGGVHLF